MALTKSTIKHLAALQQKKFRQIHGEFIVEGDKIAQELILESTYPILNFYALETWIKDHEKKLQQFSLSYESVSEKELHRISSLKTPNQVLVHCRQRNFSWKSLNPEDQLMLYIDGVQDPGNLGTIIRTADWFGVQYVFCSPDTVEFYNPKVLQSTMGAFMRVNCVYVTLETLCAQFPALPVYATSISGDNIYEYSLSSFGIIIVGNESRGISERSARLVQHHLRIPRWKDRKMESLNAAIATGIILSNFRQLITP